MAEKARFVRRPILLHFFLFLFWSGARSLGDPVSRGGVSFTKRSEGQGREGPRYRLSFGLVALTDPLGRGRAFASSRNSEECSRKAATLRGKALCVIREITSLR